MIRLVGISFLILFNVTLFAQNIPVHVTNTPIYAFIDELANDKIIQLFSAVKPYSRKLIAEKLTEAQQQREQLTPRQQKELDFYLLDYYKETDTLSYNDFYLKKYLFPGTVPIKKKTDMFSYNDALFSLTINPIFGVQVLDNGADRVMHRWNGAEMHATIDKNWGVYASLRDNMEDDTRLTDPKYFANKIGASYLSWTNNEYSEMRGGISYGWNWGSIVWSRDHFAWGDNNNGANIFGGLTPSFANIQLNIRPAKWAEFNYVHGWLGSDVVDSNKTYVYNGQTRHVFIPRYLSANMFTLQPFKGLYLSGGNSVIYSDAQNVSYLLPVMFYKSIDHSITPSNVDGQNAQMFFNISSRQIKHLHLFTSVYVDEIRIRHMWNAETHSNFISFKGGASISNLLPNLIISGEYTRTNPLAYQHFLAPTTFTNDKYNLGHYLRDNSDEVYLSLKYRPHHRIITQLSYTSARHGRTWDYAVKDKSIPDYPFGLPFMDTITWTSKVISLRLDYQWMHNAHVFINYMHNQTTGDVNTFSPYIFRGKKSIVNVGIYLGF